MKEINKSPSE